MPFMQSVAFFIVMLSVAFFYCWENFLSFMVMLSLIMLNVVMLCVVEPEYSNFNFHDFHCNFQSVL